MFHISWFCSFVQQDFLQVENDALSIKPSSLFFISHGACRATLTFILLDRLEVSFGSMQELYALFDDVSSIISM